jgi:platelet-activating factor acetylhydrolase IB subunit alpha
MVLTDRQRNDLHAGIYEYLLAQAAAAAAAAVDDDDGECSQAFARAAAALHDADPEACTSSKVQVNGTNLSSSGGSGGGSTPTKATTSATTPLLEKKWVAIPRLQKKVMELERIVAQSAKIHAHRAVASSSEDAKSSALASGGRRMLPRQPYLHKLAGHSAVVTCVAVHPVFTLAASGSEDGTIKVCGAMRIGKGRECLLFRPRAAFLLTLRNRFGTTRAANS